MEDLAYRRLLDWYYTNEQPIPLDIARAAKLIGMQDYTAEVAEILSNFFLKTEDGYSNKRCDEEIAKYQAKAERAKQANNKRWGSKTDLKSETLSDPNQEPITNNQEPDISPSLRSGEGETSAEVAPLDRCPYSKIVDLYHQILPMCPKVAKLNDTRKRHVRARWNDDLKALDNWRNYFEHVAESAFLTGRVDGKDGRPPFLADFDWLIKSANVLKVAEGKYHRS
jgi:uncharacterized protein YdaU (DUF1376 family)